MRRLIEVVYYALVCLVPFANLPIEAPSSLLNSVSRLVGLILLILTACYGFVSIMRGRRGRRLIRKDLLTIYLIMLFHSMIILLSSIFSENKVLSMNELTKYLMSISLFVLTVFIINRKRILDNALHFYMLGLNISLVIGFIEYFRGASTYGYLGEAGFISRLSGVTEPNMLALYIALGICMCYLAMMNSKKVIYRYLYLIIMVGYSVAIFLTYSRMGVIIGIFLIMYLVNRSLALTKRAKLMNLIFVGIISCSLFIIKTPFSRFFEMNRDTRILSYKESVEIGTKNPLLGIGYYGFKDVSSIKEAAHNTFLELFSGAGIFGLASFMVVIYLLYRLLVAGNVRMHARSQVYFFCMKACFYTSIIAGMFLTLHSEKITWFIYGIIVASSRVFTKANNEQLCEGRVLIEKTGQSANRTAYRYLRTKSRAR